MAGKKVLALGRMWLLGAALSGALVLCHAPAFAEPGAARQVDVEVSAAPIMSVDYTGPNVLEVDVTEPDRHSGYKVVYDAGDLIWQSNLGWTIRVKRGPWEIRKGDKKKTRWEHKKDEEAPILYVRKDSPGSQAWQLVEGDYTAWLSGATGGSGTFSGLDWQLDLKEYKSPKHKKPAKGDWRTTVTFTISGN